MGYYGQFDVNIAVKPGCIPALEAALDAHRSFGRGTQNKTLDEHMDDIWVDDVYVDYGQASALEQLADAANPDDTRTAKILGFAHQKWRGWVEDLMDVLTPFVENGSCIQIRGEEHELVEYYIEDGVFHTRSAAEIWDDDYDELKRARGAVAVANEFIRSYFEDGYEDAETALRDLRTCIAERGLEHLKP